MKTEDLIVSLARSARPVDRTPPPLTRLARWALVSLVLVAIGVSVVGARADLPSAVGRSPYILLLALSGVTAIVAAAIALILGVPGAETTRWIRALPLLLVLGWGSLLGSMVIGGGDAIGRVLALPIHVACLVEIVVFAAATGWVLVDMIRRAAPVHPTWSAAFAALAAAALGVTATQIICPIDDPAHHLTGHFVPMVLVAIVMAGISRRSLFAWLSPKESGL